MSNSAFLKAQLATPVTVANGGTGTTTSTGTGSVVLNTSAALVSPSITGKLTGIGAAFSSTVSADGGINTTTVSATTGSFSGVVSANAGIKTTTLGLSGTLTGAAASLSGKVSADAGVTTTIVSANSIYFTSTTGVVGTTTNDNAAAGSVGEYVSAGRAIASQVTITTGAYNNVTFVPLGPGDYDVWANVDFGLIGCTATLFQAGISTTSSAIGGQDTYATDIHPTTGLTGTLVFPTPHVRIPVAVSANAYLVAGAVFSVGTLGAAGSIFARRRR